MREAIRLFLEANCTTVTTWKQPFEADKDTPKPYGTVKIGPKVRGGNGAGAWRDVEIRPFIDRQNGDFWQVDQAVKEITALLDGVVLRTEAGNRFTLEWENEGQDYRDDFLDALTRTISYRVPDLV